MAAIATGDIPDDILQELNTILGQNCCLQRVDEDRSLLLGFGEIVFVKNPRGTASHGKWEIGTYRSAWRMVENRKIVCGSKEAVDSLEELRQELSKLDGVKCTKIQMITEFDLRVVFERGFSVDFLAVFGDEDEVLHIFLPEGRVVSLTNRGKWDSEDGILAS